MSGPVTHELSGLPPLEMPRKSRKTAILLKGLTPDTFSGIYRNKSGTNSYRDRSRRPCAQAFSWRGRGLPNSPAASPKSRAGPGRRMARVMRPPSLRRQVRKLPFDFLSMRRTCNDKNAFWRRQIEQAIPGLLDERTVADEWQQVFRTAGTAQGPQPRSRASRRDDAPECRFSGFGLHRCSSGRCSFRS